MKIHLSSIFVEDQEKALKFYRDKLGFIKKADVKANDYRWLTVISSDGSPDIELVLEPNANPVALEYQKGIFAQGIPATQFSVLNIYEEYEKLKNKGVKFTMEPTEMGPVIIAIFDDECGNLIQIAQFKN